MKNAIGLIALGCIAYGLWFEKSEPTYDIKINDARRLLISFCLPPLVFGSDPPDCEAKILDDSRIGWIGKRRGGEVFRYVATLTDTGKSKTKIGLDFLGASSGPAGNTQQKLNEKPALRNLFLVAMREQISSTLERRSYNFSQIVPAMAPAAMSMLSPSYSPGSGLRRVLG
ncbi:MAG: hypothetical protein ACAH20_15700 [Methylobacteriaceae bacterium]